MRVAFLFLLVLCTSKAVFGADYTFNDVTCYQDYSQLCRDSTNSVWKCLGQNLAKVSLQCRNWMQTDDPDSYNEREVGSYGRNETSSHKLEKNIYNPYESLGNEIRAYHFPSIESSNE